VGVIRRVVKTGEKLVRIGTCVASIFTVALGWRVIERIVRGLLYMATRMEGMCEAGPSGTVLRVLSCSRWHGLVFDRFAGDL